MKINGVKRRNSVAGWCPSRYYGVAEARRLLNIAQPTGRAVEVCQLLHTHHTLDSQCVLHVNKASLAE
ncbi:hypothetical protein J6590_099175 [Homalodisca vitripennis]|nr:hypothetical protein J6590_099175 [Homalodisca vitripennis]